MIRRSQFTSSEIALPVLIALSLSHCLNDLLQSLLAASYPLFKEDLALSFGQIGLITLVYQMAASVFQPLAGLFFDKRPFVWSLPAGMCFTLVGLLNLAFASNLHWVLVSVFLIGVGSSILHPEASRITSLASGGRRGFAQSVFQVGGNLGGSFGPLLMALLVAPYGRHNIAYFAIVAFVAILVMIPVCRWYKAYLRRVKWRPANAVRHAPMPLPHGRTFFAIAILLTLIFSKYIYIEKDISFFIGPHGDIRSRSLNGNAAQTVHSGRRGIEAHLYGGRFAVQRDKIRGRIDQSDLSAPQHHAVGLHHKKAFVEGLHRFVVIEPVEGLTLLLALCAFRFADRLAVIGRLCRDSCKEQAQQADQYHIPYHIVCVLNLRIA